MLTKRRIEIIITLLFALVPVFIIIYSNINKKRMSKDHSYTVATVYGVKFQGKLGNGIYYKYRVYGHDYEDSYTTREERANLRELVGKKFYLKFYNRNPKTNEILFDKSVPSSTGDPPQNGWAKIPSDRRKM
jgi:hypothetical protein